VTGPYRDGRVHVLDAPCSTCILIPGAGSIRHNLSPGRVPELVRDNLAADSAPPCHHTTYDQDPQGEAVCRGFYDLFRDRVTPLQLAARLGMIAWQTLTPTAPETP
jgi:hypothetical protein